MKKLFYGLSCLLVLSSSPVLAQTTEPDIVIVRISELEGGRARIVICRGVGKNTVMELSAGLSEKGMITTAETYYQLVAKLYQEGYVLQGSVKAGEYLSTLLFIKPSKA